MKTFADCLEAMAPEQSNLVIFFDQFVAAREYRRAAGLSTEAMDALRYELADAIQQGPISKRLREQLNPAVKDGDPADIEAFGNRMGALGAELKDHPPAYDVDSCQMDWRTLACLYNGAAQAYLAGDMQALETHLDGLVEGGKVVPRKITCDDAVMRDNFYSQEPWQRDTTGPPWWALLGVLGIGAVAVWPLVCRKK